MPRPGRSTPGKENRYPFYRRLGGPQGRSGRERKISPNRSPDRPVRSESLYRLSYPGPQNKSVDDTLKVFPFEALLLLQVTHAMCSDAGYPVSTHLWLLELSIFVKPVTCVLVSNAAEFNARQC